MTKDTLFTTPHSFPAKCYQLTSNNKQATVNYYTFLISWQIAVTYYRQMKKLKPKNLIKTDTVVALRMTTVLIK